jgi:Protein of unknown function (DUF1260).
MTKSKKKEASRPKLGDVFGLRLDNKPGLVCFQFVDVDPVMGELVLVFPPIRPDTVSIQDVKESAEQFFIFTAVNAMWRAGLLVRLGNASAPAVPAMRLPGGIERSGRPLNWWIYSPDGQKHRVDTLSPEQERLSIRQFANADTLYHLVDSGWTPATAEAHRLRAAAREDRAETRRTATPDKRGEGVTHYVYFKTREAVDKAAAAFRQRSYEVSVSPSADPGSGWLLKVETGADTDASDQIEELTVTLNGEYDGWETRAAIRRGSSGLPS